MEEFLGRWKPWWGQDAKQEGCSLLKQQLVRDGAPEVWYQPWRQCWAGQGRTPAPRKRIRNASANGMLREFDGLKSMSGEAQDNIVLI